MEKAGGIGKLEKSYMLLDGKHTNWFMYIFLNIPEKCLLNPSISRK